ncbi:hypothetical protein CBR_g39664 [Chara braunii]|uniref:Uncharacterized protein n=1 Tax=Chara braunii TaxID=69332 RepID=A0A388K1P5_CHABU|nr:hypothetical protein CBR_g39664 [Chara braunii]|eukprot:GBG63883.1 hypothetical protein CBR_g39664 [Chara braunii]
MIIAEMTESEVTAFDSSLSPSASASASSSCARPAVPGNTVGKIRKHVREFLDQHFVRASTLQGGGGGGMDRLNQDDGCLGMLLDLSVIGDVCVFDSIRLIFGVIAMEVVCVGGGLHCQQNTCVRISPFSSVLQRDCIHRDQGNGFKGRLGGF